MIMIDSDGDKWQQYSSTWGFQVVHLWLSSELRGIGAAARFFEAFHLQAPVPRDCTASHWRVPSAGEASEGAVMV